MTLPFSYTTSPVEPGWDSFFGFGGLAALSDAIGVASNGFGATSDRSAVDFTLFDATSGLFSGLFVVVGSSVVALFFLPVAGWADGTTGVAVSLDSGTPVALV